MSSVLIKNLSLKFGAVSVLDDLNLDVSAGEFLVLLGASGCGKSTLLNCIAGLLDLSDGEIHINGRNVTWKEPSKRGIGMVFQSYALYPRMTVAGNLSFGLRNAGVPKREIARRVKATAEALQISQLLKRKPSALSGGQRQRVAIGRALMRNADVFLFDEPLSNLDAKLRGELRGEIKRLHRQLKSTMIYVTHDQVEAMILADRIAVLKSGAIQQLDSPKEVYNRPQNKYVAGFIGSPEMNFLEGIIDGKEFISADVNIPLDGYEFQHGRADGAAWLGIRPEHVKSDDSAIDQPFSSEVVVEMLDPMGSETLAWTSLAAVPFRFRLNEPVTVRPGDRVAIGFDLAHASLFDKTTEQRL